MMQSYIDSKFLVHFFESFVKSQRRSKEEEIIYEILDFLTSKTDLILKSDFQEILNMLDPPLKNQCSVIVSDLTTGRQGTKILSNKQNALYHLRNVELYSRVKKPFASFWIGNQYRHDTEIYRERNPYYFLTNVDFKEEWLLMNKRETYSVGPGLDQENEKVFNSWDQIESFSHLFKDIIIADRHCLKDRTLIEMNIVPLIANLSQNNTFLKNIVLFVEKSNNLQINLNLLRDWLSAININANIGVYVSNKKFHYRKIVTNSIHIHSDDSFDFFEPNGFKTNGATLTAEPMYEFSNPEFTRFFKFCNKIRERAEDPNYVISFIGDNLSTNMLDLINNE